MNKALTSLDLFADSSAVFTIACGEFGCSSDVPAISDATVPSTVVVVVAAERTPFSAFLNTLCGLKVDLRFGSVAPPSRSVSARHGMSVECW